MRALLILATAAACVGAAPAALSAPATGSFKSQGITMPVKTAIAFRGTSLLDQSDVIVVAITNAQMHVEAMTAYYDRRRAIERRIKDSDTPVVYFEFRPNGNYRGYSFYFASGNGCGYCGGSLGVTSTVKLANGKLVGSLKGGHTDRTFDLTLDIPIASDDHGAPLPADGGAPGKTYQAYHAALVKRDAKELRPLLSDELRETLADATKEGKAAKYMNYLAREHPSKAVQITKGFANGKEAVLLITGESSTSKLTGEVQLLNQGGTWRVDDELTDVVMK